MQFMGYKGITGIEYPDGSVTPFILRSELNEIGYDTLEPRILNAADYGVPQRRNRIIFMGYRRGLTPPQYPEPTVKPEERLTLLDAIGDLISDSEKKATINPAPTQYQLDSFTGELPQSMESRLRRNALQTPNFRSKRILCVNVLNSSDRENLEHILSVGLWKKELTFLISPA